MLNGDGYYGPKLIWIPSTPCPEIYHFLNAITCNSNF